VLIASVSGFFGTWLMTQSAREEIKKQSFNQLSTIRKIKKERVERQFELFKKDILSLSRGMETITALKEMAKSLNEFPPLSDEFLRAFYQDEFLPALKKMGLSDVEFKELYPKDQTALYLQSRYLIAHDAFKTDENLYHQYMIRYQPYFEYHLRQMGLADLYLIDLSGRVVYSAQKNIDFGRRVSEKFLSDSGLAKSIQELRKGDRDVVLMDFESYLPDLLEPSAFMAVPIKGQNKTIGYLVARIPIDEINKIMTSNRGWELEGLGNTGETYLVGQDFLMRSDSRFLFDEKERYFSQLKILKTDPKVIEQIRNFNRTILLQKIDTEGSRSAFKGVTDTRVIKDYRGVDVLSSFSKLEITGLQWIILSEIDEAEAFSGLVGPIKKTVLIFVVIILFSLVMGMYFANSISRPLKNLAIGVERISEGHFNTRVEASGTREIAGLAEKFNHMNEMLESSTVSKSHLNELLQSLNTLLIVTEFDRDSNLLHLGKTKVTLINKMVKDKLGYGEEVLGTKLEDLILDQIPELEDKRTFLDLQAGNSLILKTDLISSQKELRKFSLTVTGMPSFKSGIQSFILTGNDLSESEAMLQKLSISDKNLATAQRIAHIGSWDWDIINNTLSWSDEIYKIFGLEPQEFEATFEAFLKSVHPDDHAKLNQRVQDALVGESLYHFEHRVVRPDGEIRIVEERGEVFRNEENHPIRMIGTVHDITLKKTIEDELIKSREELEIRVEQRTAEAKKLLRAIEQSPNSVVITNEKGVIEYVNPTFVKVFGYSEQEALGKTPRILKSDNLNQQDYKELWETILSGQQWRGEFHNLRKDGTRCWQLASISPVKNDQGEITHFISSQENLDHLKQVQSELKEALEEASRANQAKSVFLSSMSHELRTPLNSIIGFAQLLESDEDDPLNDFQRDNLSQILKGGYHLLELINEILDLSKIESGRLQISMEPVQLSSVVEEVIAIINPLAEKHGISLYINEENLETYVLADRVRLKQVLLNLVSNAVKYNRKKGKVEVYCDLMPQDKCRISVKDTGNGISDAHMAFLFEPFNRLGNEASSIEGTGIGLTITKKIVELMGGNISAESKLGEGSLFYFELKNTSRPDFQVKLEGIYRQSGLKSVGEKSVLYVEDNPANMKLVTRLIERRHGISLFTATEPMKGLELAFEKTPDLILLDINLPGMDGFEILSRLKANEKTHDIPIVAVTANAMPNDIKYGLESGFDQYITKPINIQQFMAVLDNYLV